MFQIIIIGMQVKVSHITIIFQGNNIRSSLRRLTFLLILFCIAFFCSLWYMVLFYLYVFLIKMQILHIFINNVT